jgi:opacity protein-like surface antigen
MKGMLKGVAALALASALFTTSAQAQTSMQFGIGGGATLPLGDFADAAKSIGFHGLVNAEFQPANLPVGFRIEGMYNRLSFHEDQTTDGNFQIISGTANVVYTFMTAEESKFHPYLIGGGGAYNFKASPEGFDSDSETKFGFNAGAGFNMAMGGAAVFIEGRFHRIMIGDGGDVNMVPISIGVRFGGSGN